MYYIKAQTVKNAISNLISIEYKGNLNKDLLPFFLILKYYGLTKYTPLTLNGLNNKKDEMLKVLYELGGMFAPNEYPLKRACLFFTSFNKISTAQNTALFYNAGTEFKKLVGRLKDTIDNTISDYILNPQIKNGEKFYTLKNNVEHIVSMQYSTKIPFASFVIWLYRYRAFNNPISLKQLELLFLKEYNMNKEDLDILFDFNPNNIDFENNTYIKGNELRQYLNIDSRVEINNTNKEMIFYNNTYIDVNKISFLTGGNIMINSDMVLAKLLKYKQIILTGVPGTGKSYLTETLKKSFDSSLRVQFHSNFTYQDFICGKIIKDGNIVEEPGVVLNFVSNIEQDKKYLLILDEINRGDISAIFGEFIYALDRNNVPIKVGNQELILPDNLYIIGTMNSSDRSIAMVDYAIRRRFTFMELFPDYELLDSLSNYNGELLLGKFLRTINYRIVKYLKNNDFQLGHSFFIKSEKEWSDEDVYDCIHFKIIPMLKEYTYGDEELLNSILSKEIQEASLDILLNKIKDYIALNED